MARLSEEHFKSNSDTPARKHSRFKEIFKYRSIPHSNSASPAIITTASPVLRPLGSPTMKPGYEQVGLLPSERTSLETAKRLLEENGGAAVKEAIEDDLQGLKDVCMPGDLNMGHDLLGVTRADEIAKRVTKEQKEEQKRKNERNFGEESSGHQNERAEHVDFAEGSSSSFLVLRTAESKRKLEALAPSQDNLAKQSLSKTFGNRSKYQCSLGKSYIAKRI